ncbi:MAG: ABC transporter ATP-binding protein [Treponema sp.]|jgi:ABC-type Fe3+/spermidine/putrescine transport system ATPase subunit|nr:ABC transporter ATP-binding protein [Treponema sp.]
MKTEPLIETEPVYDVELISISKYYGKFAAVDNFSLAVPRGSFTTLLGPSGCGKTTLLRIIAGFFEPDRGTVRIRGKDQQGVAPEKRSEGMVFQDYALFPHMNTAENLAYGLILRKLPPEERRREVQSVAETLGIEGLLKHYPSELSGGQQQRLALGRVIILKPQILLMDEPLSNLDAKLRVHVRDELKDIQKRLGITTIYVTHDQEEALSLSDCLAVMNKGRLEQLGRPEDVYMRPATSFAADFSGPANFLTINGKRCLIRPEWIEVQEADSRAAPSSLSLTGKVKSADFFGRVIRLRVEIDTAEGRGRLIAVDIPSGLPGEEPRFGTGSRVCLLVRHIWELPADERAEAT